MALGRLKYIRNSGDLRAIVNAEVERALEKVGDKALRRLDEIIVRDIYAYEYFPNVRYVSGGGTNQRDSNGEQIRSAQPTFQFRKAWLKHIEKVFGNNKSELSIQYDPTKIGDSHNSIVDGQDVSEWLDEILNVDGFTSPLSVGSMERGNMRNVSKYRQPYWDNFMKEMTQGRKIRQWLKEELNSQGLDVK